ncbi:GTP cyclohydrolase II [Candidatus Parcubacteria bacterium]|nr:MAG: GTP cyclohydrolase II [Candidatus Parcubacteria bacterium]
MSLASVRAVPIPETELMTEFGAFVLRYHATWHHLGKKRYVSLTIGDLQKDMLLVRLQSACLFAAFRSLECDCGTQLQHALSRISNEKRGVLIYGIDDEGRGAGIEAKMAGMYVEHELGCSTNEAYKELGLERDYRTFTHEANVLKQLKVATRIRLIGSERKCKALEDAGFVVERVDG